MSLRKIQADYFNFMPFQKRASIYPDDFVVGVKFPFDQAIVDHFREAIKIGNDYFTDKQRLKNVCGGWSDKYKCWWFEADMFHKIIIPLLESLNCDVTKKE